MRRLKQVRHSLISRKKEHETSSSNVDGVNQQSGSGHGLQNLHNPPHDPETQQVHPATATTMHPAQGGNATQQVASPTTPTLSQGHYQTLTPNSIGSPDVSHSLPTTQMPHLGSSHIPTSSNTLPTQSHYLNNSSPVPQVQGHSSAHPSAPVQQGHLPTGPSSSEVNLANINIIIRRIKEELHKFLQGTTQVSSNIIVTLQLSHHYKHLLSFICHRILYLQFHCHQPRPSPIYLMRCHQCQPSQVIRSPWLQQPLHTLEPHSHYLQRAEQYLPPHPLMPKIQLLQFYPEQLKL